MKAGENKQLRVAIACGGTGGHLFPGLAIAEQLARREVDVTLLVSEKEVDQTAVQGTSGMSVLALPAIGLTRGRLLDFLRAFLRSYNSAARWFGQHRPHAVLAMGGFTSAPPILAGRRCNAVTFLHESNTIPGRANRWLSWIVKQAFVGFPSTARRLHSRRVACTGTPVRSVFRKLDSAACRLALGLDAARPVALVMGGSQGAHGINELVAQSLPSLAKRAVSWQWLHLAGPADREHLRQVYTSSGLTSRVESFLGRMDWAMGAATACISRAGASSLAELAAVRLPAVLIPYPAATDNHQFHNARAFEQSGAAKLLEQSATHPQDLIACFEELMCDDSTREQMKTALAKWDYPQAAQQIASAILETVGKVEFPVTASSSEGVGPGASVRRSKAPPPNDGAVRLALINGRIR